MYKRCICTRLCVPTCTHIWRRRKKRDNEASGTCRRRSLASSNLLFILSNSIHSFVPSTHWRLFHNSQAPINCCVSVWVVSGERCAFRKCVVLVLLLHLHHHRLLRLRVCVRLWAFTDIYFHVVVILFIRNPVSLSLRVCPNTRYLSLFADLPLLLFISSLLFLPPFICVCHRISRGQSFDTNTHMPIPLNFLFQMRHNGNDSAHFRAKLVHFRMGHSIQKPTKLKMKRKTRSLTLFVDAANGISMPATPQTGRSNHHNWCHNFPPIKSRLIFLIFVDFFLLLRLWFLIFRL